MAGIALPRADFTGTGQAARRRTVRNLFRLTGRYTLSALGPVAVSGAHFVASVAFLHTLPPAEFGLFSFLLVIVPFCLSASSALLGAPLASAMRNAATVTPDNLATYSKVNLMLSALAGLVVCALFLVSHARLGLALLLGCYGTVMTLRWFVRSLSYANGHYVRAVASDLLYSGLLIAGLSGLLHMHALGISHAAIILLGSAIFSLLAFGRGDLLDQFRPGPEGSLSAYATVWQSLTRWSLLGVVFSELAANAHAYFVTFISGPQAFALLALGGLLMRPVSLVLTALPDMERPIMARRLAAGDVKGAFRSVNEFRTAALAVLIVTIALSAALLIWFPHLLLKQGYDRTQALIAIALWTVITAVRALRTPDAVFLQAAGEFRPLAHAGMAASLTSLATTLLLLVCVGPVASLGGILAGELIVSARTFSLTRDWKCSHA